MKLLMPPDLLLQHFCAAVRCQAPAALMKGVLGCPKVAWGIWWTWKSART